MENVSLQFQRGIIMEKQNWKFYWKWSVFVLMTMLCLLSFYKSYQNVKYELQEESQTLFQRAVQDDTNRRIKDLGDAFCFSYSGANRLERDSITIKTADTIIHMKNNKEVARRMSSQEKSDFSLQHYLSMENPIQVTLLDSAFRASLYEHAIPAQTVTCYTFIDKTECSSSDTSFYQSFIPLKEIVFGANRAIVLQAFVQFPFLYIVGEVFLRNIFWILAMVILWVIAIVLTWKRPRINILPLQEAPKEMIQIKEDILFDETHGVLHYHRHRIELANQRLKLFLAMVILWVIAIVLTWKRPRINILPLQEAPKEMIQIKEDILFDETHGVLHYHRHRIELANQRLKLFCILLEHKGYFIESDQLKEEIWPDGSVSKDALTATAKRLKEDLSPIPGLVIESARGKGYSLKIVSGE